MAKFLVTGGCGFIGSHLADALVRRGDRVFILDDLSTGKIANRPRHAQLVVGDVRDPSAVAELMAEVDGCFHLAAIASVERTNRDWPNTHRTNLGGTVAVLDAAWRVRVHAPIPVVYASSAAVYGSNPAMPLRESSVAMPVSAYGADKLGSELHARAGGVVHNIPTLGLRLFNVYGPRQDFALALLRRHFDLPRTPSAPPSDRRVRGRLSGARFHPCQRRRRRIPRGHGKGLDLGAGCQRLHRTRNYSPGADRVACRGPWRRPRGASLSLARRRHPLLPG